MLEMDIREQLRRPVDPAEYKAIRREWIAHSIAEDNHDIPGLMATLTDDCVYELPQEGRVWHGKAGATAFYTELLTAFPDIHFELQTIVIGPQGVFEEAHVTGTHQARWLDYPATGRYIEFKVTIYFPWDSEQQKFSGERVYFIMEPGLLLAAAQAKAVSS